MLARVSAFQASWLADWVGPMAACTGGPSVGGVDTNRRGLHRRPNCTQAMPSPSWSCQSPRSTGSGVRVVKQFPRLSGSFPNAFPIRLRFSRRRQNSIEFQRTHASLLGRARDSSATGELRTPPSKKVYCIVLGQFRWRAKSEPRQARRIRRMDKPWRTSTPPSDFAAGDNVWTNRGRIIAAR